jgi:hypothetical protein
MTLLKNKQRKTAKRVGELAGKLIDDRIRDAEWCELQSLLTRNDDAGRAYGEAVLLHVGLHRLGSERRKACDSP